MKNPSQSASHRKRGAALIAVLSLIVLMAALVTVFLVRTAMERSASASYDAAAGTRLLGETTVNLVQATINQATSGTSAQAWASQPGAIRVFNNSGALTRIYRLYSGTEVATTTSSGDILANDIPLAGWASDSATWVDLNKPVTVSGTNGTASDYLVYPILDPRDPKDPGTATAPKVLTDLEGFSITNAPGATTLQPAPMPVRWLYVLRDGKIVTPTGGSGSTATFSGSNKPTSQNPITGRIAFWTDDETAKVNVNTAGGSISDRGAGMRAAPWETPRFSNTDEANLFARNQPVKGEYQRYPGHPASTQLYPIFSALGLSMVTPYPGAAATSSGLFNLLPRYNDDRGSKSGTVNTTSSNSPPAITVKQERLYTSVGELMYPPSRIARTDPNVITRQQLESGKFLLTASSRSPEVNLFGKPRIAIWPIDKDLATPPVDLASNRVTTFDKLIAFCARTGGASNPKPYFFQRRNSWSPTADFDPAIIPRNPELYSYLQALTAQSNPIPGFGGTFESKYGQAERDQILTEIVDYIRSTNVYDHRPEPGNTHPRYTRGQGAAGSGQVSPLEITTNGRVTRGLGRYFTFSEIGVHIICTAEGSTVRPYVPPVDIGGKPVSPVVGSANDPQYVSNLPVRQFLRDTSGNIVGWDSAGLTYTAGTSGTPFPANKTLADTYSVTDDPGPGTELAPGVKRLQAILLMEVHCPMQGYAEIYPSYHIQTAGLAGLSLGGQIGLFSDGTYSAYHDRFNSTFKYGGLNGFRILLGNNTNSNSIVSGWTSPTSSNRYPFVSKPFTHNSPTLEIGGAFSIQTAAVPLGSDLPAGVTANVPIPIQTFNVTFPGATGNLVPPPDLLQYGITDGTVGGTETTLKTGPSDWWGFDTRIQRVFRSAGQGTGNTNQSFACFVRVDPSTTPSTWDLGNRSNTIPIRLNTTANDYSPTWPGVRSDVVRSLIAKDGDARLIAAKDTVVASGATSGEMVKQAGYDSGAKVAHSFMDGSGSDRTTGADLGGKLAPLGSTNYGVRMTPKVPRTLVYPYGDMGPQVSMDWDNGLPSATDGAYANKPDEGNAYTGGGATPYYGSPEQAGNSTSYFTANRIIPSPVMFGSLPTGVSSGIPWRTLLFRPHQNRPAWASPSGPKDHLLLDLFYMPMVEPYAISEPFSTAGKVNMNYQIVPFTYIQRSTALRAVLDSELIAKVPKSEAARVDAGTPVPRYKYQTSNANIARLPLNMSGTNGTLRQFEEKFVDDPNAAIPIPKDIFKSASEICDLYLVPQGYTLDEFRGTGPTSWYGDDFALVGDNVRERPYGDIYPRLTTKSNTFTVHYTVQTLKNPPGQDPATWNDARGAVTGELRGSTTLERFLDPADSKIPDYATDSTAASLDTFYQWRVISSNTFAP